MALDEVVTFRLDQLQQQYYKQACQPPITRVSRQVRREALPTYYEISTFVLHTEGPKAEDALRWLHCNQHYLCLLRSIRFWIRHLPYGAIEYSLVRARKGESWTVDPNWRWITVVKRPSTAEEKAKRIYETINKSDVLTEISKETTTPRDYFTLIKEIRSQ